MPSSFTDVNAPSLQGTLPKRPRDLPHGLLPPPPRVLDIVAHEKAKFPLEVFTPEAEERLTSDLTLQYYFDQLGYDVAYRSSPQGAEVLAVGEEEIDALRKTMTEDAWRNLKTWQF